MLQKTASAGSQSAIARASADGISFKTKVLFVLSTAERELFLPGFEYGALGLSEGEGYWLDPLRTETSVWEKVLSEYQPAILVTAWTSPSIPRQWALGDRCPLRYVCNITGSVRRVVSRELIEHGLLVTNWGSNLSHTVAEHAMLLLLGAMRGVTHWPDAMTKPTYVVHKILPDIRTRSLRGKRVGIHGFGAVARELVEMLRPHQVDITAYSHPVPMNIFEKHGIVPCASLEELFSRSDVLVECESLTPETRGMVTDAILRRLPDDAAFVNVGRAGVVDEVALARLAMEKKIRVALDVFGSEPLPVNAPWFEIPGALLSPHIAGPTWDTYPKCGEFALSNIAKFMRGEAVEGVVTPEIYDHST